MASLPQTSTQTGPVAILAALGQAAPSGSATDAPGFEQLFASLPGNGTTAAANPAAAQSLAAPAAATAALLEVPVTTMTPSGLTAPADGLAKAEPSALPATVTFGMPQLTGGASAPPAPIETKAPVDLAAKPVVTVATSPETAPATDAAAAAASLLIAVAAPFKRATPAGEKASPAATKADAPVDGAAASEAVTASAQPIAQPLTVEAPGATVVVVAAMPTAEKSVTQKPAKTATPNAPETAPSASPAGATIKTADVARPLPLFTPMEPKGPAKPAVDANASMTVLFAQPGLQGAAPLTEAAKTAPVAERLLDMGSDDQWIAQLAADIAATKSDKGDISFRLMPRHLGRLDVSMLTGDAGVTVKLDTQHEATAAIVQAAQPRLVDDLRQQGVRVAEAQVTHTPADAGRQQQQPQGQGRQGAPGASHLIETAPERHGADREDRAADRRGRFA